ncbi:MAG: transposase [Chlorobium sp.]|nr:MAG: transposase [Chlorobium sp.]
MISDTTQLSRMAPDIAPASSVSGEVHSRVNYPGRFEDLNEARLWMAAFVHWYNTEHLHSSLGYVTPEQMRSGQAEAIFEQRNRTMRHAQATHPERWGSRPVKHWKVLREVVLNPDKKD